MYIYIFDSMHLHITYIFTKGGSDFFCLGSHVCLCVCHIAPLQSWIVQVPVEFTREEIGDLVVSKFMDQVS